LLQLYQQGNLKAAQDLQSQLSHANWALSKVGVAGVKAVVSHHFGYGTGRGRRPLGLTSVTKLSIDTLERIQQAIDIEKGLISA
jgi:4-hydroxy-2-oxoglutarate aldolase